MQVKREIDRAAVDREILPLGLLLVQPTFVAALQRIVKAGRGDMMILPRGSLHGGVIGARFVDEPFPDGIETFGRPGSEPTAAERAGVPEAALEAAPGVRLGVGQLVD